ncbi:UNVERIFIED_CONTAM: hypothetical protein HDU68_009121 [Siphonaria sp. JEL0065]|nr:hypothetical protein HDU68_009121 [Siphonaria sp. JEL0065]
MLVVVLIALLHRALAFTNGTLLPEFLCGSNDPLLPNSLGVVLDHSNFDRNTSLAFNNAANDNINVANNTATTPPKRGFNTAYLLASFHNSQNSLDSATNILRITSNTTLQSGKPFPIIISSRSPGIPLGGALIYAVLGSDFQTRLGSFTDAGVKFSPFPSCGKDAASGAYFGVVHNQLISVTGIYAHLSWNAPASLIDGQIIVMKGLIVDDLGFGTFSASFTVGEQPSKGASNPSSSSISQSTLPSVSTTNVHMDIVIPTGTPQETPTVSTTLPNPASTTIRSTSIPSKVDSNSLAIIPTATAPISSTQDTTATLPKTTPNPSPPASASVVKALLPSLSQVLNAGGSTIIPLTVRASDQVVAATATPTLSATDNASGIENGPQTFNAAQPITITFTIPKSEKVVIVTTISLTPSLTATTPLSVPTPSKTIVATSGSSITSVPTVANPVSNTSANPKPTTTTSKPTASASSQVLNHGQLSTVTLTVPATEKLVVVTAVPAPGILVPATGNGPQTYNPGQTATVTFTIPATEKLVIVTAASSAVASRTLSVAPSVASASSVSTTFTKNSGATAVLKTTTSPAVSQTTTLPTTSMQLTSLRPTTTRPIIAAQTFNPGQMMTITFTVRATDKLVIITPTPGAQTVSYCDVFASFYLYLPKFTVFGNNNFANNNPTGSNINDAANNQQQKPLCK